MAFGIRWKRSTVEDLSSVRKQDQQGTDSSFPYTVKRHCGKLICVILLHVWSIHLVFIKLASAYGLTLTRSNDPDNRLSIRVHLKANYKAVVNSDDL
ncbi:hypothetical protein F2P81_019126 [Scophthalmus maximus]|uniref:Uncharacterized protein n=1 Tax=Scophthalmus maximus TaxID=52904 RepID=A0A6A4S653_SCOMX|nr:hypothetical protein F2P81_019126 [Scophthalmus maximus]